MPEISLARPADAKRVVPTSAKGMAVAFKIRRIRIRCLLSPPTRHVPGLF